MTSPRQEPPTGGPDAQPRPTSSLGAEPGPQSLARSLSWPHLVAMGVGAIVGTGILTLIGIGADKAGPAVLLSFLIAGFVCACAAMCYAEMASPVTEWGSAHTYSRVAP